MATNKTLLPPPYQTVEDINGYAMAGATVTFLNTGTAGLAVVYADADGLVVSANPLTIDAAGRFTVFLSPGQVVDVQYRDALGTLIKTVPGVSAVPSASGNVDMTGVLGEAVVYGQTVYLSDGSGGKTAGRWWLAQAAQLASVSTVGLALGAGVANGTITVRTSGRVDGLTGLVVGAKYYTSDTAGALSLVLGFNYRVVGQADSTTSLVLHANPFDTRNYVQTTNAPGVYPQLTMLGPVQTLQLQWGGTGGTIQGIKAGYHGQRLRIMNKFSAPVDLVHLSPAALPGDRLLNLATSGPSSLALNGWAEYEYDWNAPGPYWRLVGYEQGAWITPVFSAANFTATGGTWTVAGGNIAANRYILRGNTLLWYVYLVGSTTIGGTPSQLLLRIPGGFSAPVQWTGVVRVPQIYDSAGEQQAIAGPASGSTTIALQKNNNVAWAAGASPVVLLTITLEVA